MYPYRHPIYQRQSFSRIVFRILALLALVLFFLMTYEPARCQTPRNPNITAVKASLK